jgi:hypothetical protein
MFMRARDSLQTKKGKPCPAALFCDYHDHAIQAPHEGLLKVNIAGVQALLMMHVFANSRIPKKTRSSISMFKRLICFKPE